MKGRISRWAYIILVLVGTAVSVGMSIYLCKCMQVLSMPWPCFLFFSWAVGTSIPFWIGVTMRRALYDPDESTYGKIWGDTMSVGEVSLLVRSLPDRYLKAISLSSTIPPLLRDVVAFELVLRTKKGTNEYSGFVHTMVLVRNISKIVEGWGVIFVIGGLPLMALGLSWPLFVGVSLVSLGIGFTVMSPFSSFTI